MTTKTQNQLPHAYEEQVYAGLLGKIVGVYMGRPFEGWSKKALQDRWGIIDRYVHEDCNVPLVVSDDDISGTLTFVRALEDSGLYENTPGDFFGKTWLNYLVEDQTILWWGGLGLSTEHTAFLRLKAGIPSPRSGSAELNGKAVSEQIGAQIFIDAFGMVLPGQPERAARLARRAASVAHDGEAVHAAALVAAMVSAAFVEKDMDTLLDIGLAQIPANSIIAAIHRDVRAWAKEDRDWEKTWERINECYGYHRYGGNCHVVPNHAVMVMAWVYAPDDFHMAQALVNTAGWDTDCNAANVGALMGVKMGLQGINARYDFQSPFGDRVLLPTADGSRASTDVLLEAMHVARMGRVLMGWPELPPPKEGAWHHFSQPGAQHGWLATNGDFSTRGNAVLANVPCEAPSEGRCLRISLRVGPGRTARVETPLAPFNQKEDAQQTYRLTGTPKLYAGQSAKVTLRAANDLSGPVRQRLRLRLQATEGTQPSAWVDGDEALLAPGETRSLSITVPPEAASRPAYLLALEVNADDPVTGDLFLDRVVL
jgi:ADP-ribosylglycohydrolase